MEANSARGRRNSRVCPTGRAEYYNHVIGLAACSLRIKTPRLTNCQPLTIPLSARSNQATFDNPSSSY